MSTARRVSRAVRSVGSAGSDRSIGSTATLRPALLAAARAAARRAYAPYSGFPVGAALLSEDGRTFAAANVENASYGLTICAERAAVLQAVNAGARCFRALAVVVRGRTPATPCGACRQVLAEFCDQDMPVFCGTQSGRLVQCTTVGRLLPAAFHLKRPQGHAPIAALVSKPGKRS